MLDPGAASNRVTTILRRSSICSVCGLNSGWLRVREQHNPLAN